NEAKINFPVEIIPDDITVQMRVGNGSWKYCENLAPNAANELPFKCWDIWSMVDQATKSGEQEVVQVKLIDFGQEIILSYAWNSRREIATGVEQMELVSARIGPREIKKP